MKVLASDKLSKDGAAVFAKAGIQLDLQTGLSEDELVKIIPEYDALIVRSETKVTPKIIKAGRKLKIIGRAGVGVDNIDLPSATEQGIIVVNSPEGNTIAAAEHTLAMMLSMARKIPQAYHTLVKNHQWNRSAFQGVELYGKTLGVVGLGKIGSHVAKCSLALGMRVLAYDPFVTKEYAESHGIEIQKLDEVLREADFITLHIPKTNETKGLLNKEKFALMKKGVRIVNCARGGIIVEADLAEALESGQVAGAAIDVFEDEKEATASPLLTKELPTLVAVPHLGASTAEAQINVAVDVAQQIVTVLQGGSASAPVNIPTMRPALLEPVKPYLNLAEKLGRFIGQVVKDTFSAVEINYKGEVAAVDPSPLSTIILKGILESINPEGHVNFVNAPLIAKEKNITVKSTRSEKVHDYANEIEIIVNTKKVQASICGTLFASVGERIINVDGFTLSAIPQGILLIFAHQDKPGIIGKVGNILGESKVNIAGMQVGREKIGGKAIMLINIDNEIDDTTLDKISKIDGLLDKARIVKF
ncbi:D-3-phosphoglycerate dehydrogenase [Candidatus Termititenax persephonae]|uniref:D-3-phosphoglycerate dehydrogenase n=1 Tax=Candidatus Termititenax persephonae TaxID=2218525 RepID=A0A388TH85_9BACT|nr:D-3-phosphoglycerate dehydrogenase [Candidatus Termititenax persephonae]